MHCGHHTHIACTCIPALVYMFWPSYTCPGPHTHVLDLIHVSWPSYMCPGPHTCVLALIHVSWPSYICHSPHTCVLPLVHSPWPSYTHPGPHTCVLATSTFACVSPCIPTSCLHPLCLPCLTCVPL